MFFSSLPSRIDARRRGIAVIMTATIESIPPVLLNIVTRFRTLHETVLLTTVANEQVPHTGGARFQAEKIWDGVYRVTLHYGYMDEPHVHKALCEVLARIAPDADPAELTYILGKERIVSGPRGAMGPIAERLFAVLARNAADPSDVFDLPAAQVVEVGGHIDL